MVFMLMGVVSPGGEGCPGRAAFTKVLETGGVSLVYSRPGWGRKEGGEEGIVRKYGYCAYF